jgi:hypothetical protein
MDFVSSVFPFDLHAVQFFLYTFFDGEFNPVAINRYTAVNWRESILGFRTTQNKCGAECCWHDFNGFWFTWFLKNSESFT